MNRVPLYLLGIFFTLAFAWTTIVLTNQISYGALSPVVDQNDNKAYPQVLSGLAGQGKLVYQDLGCVSCHTQQVRAKGYGTDFERKWGERGSMARDYIRESRVLLGDLRIGPDLRNIGARAESDGRTREWHYRHLYDPQLTSPGSVMPPYRFLFETRKIVGEPSTRAVQSLLPAQYQPEPGHEIVPSRRAEALVEYLLNLKDTYTYPDEASKVAAPAAKGKETEKEQGKKAEGHK